MLMSSITQKKHFKFADSFVLFLISLRLLSTMLEPILFHIFFLHTYVCDVYVYACDDDALANEKNHLGA
jgi:hypothetical protein